MPMNVQVITFYKFYKIKEELLKEIEEQINSIGKKIDELAKSPLTLRGLCIMGTEGLNATFSVDKNYADQFKSAIIEMVGTSDIVFKDSFTETHPFHDLKVKVRKEIVSLSRPDLVPQEKNHHHLTPKEWHEAMKSPDVVVIDTRNSYEYEIGHFQGALDPKTREFNEFPDWVRQSQLAKDQKILIYCTGGIRCEKAILEMEEQGYKNVYQLEGGILNYLKDFPQGHWNGECFVFDYRVAVDSHLQPSKSYKLCPHCGQPAKTSIDCIQCGVSEVVCNHCMAKGDEFKTCSKNCAHHFRMGHKSRRIHHDSFRKRLSSQAKSNGVKS
jgi:UPF0176 protein